MQLWHILEAYSPDWYDLSCASSTLIASISHVLDQATMGPWSVFNGQSTIVLIFANFGVEFWGGVWGCFLGSGMQFGHSLQTGV